MATEEVNKLQSLPPYPEMIMKALEALNEADGSSKSAISKYIETTYGELPDETVLGSHLNKMKESGELAFKQNNYMKADSKCPHQRGDVEEPPKPKVPFATRHCLCPPPRPRGRPPKRPLMPPP
uniref:H15 domain-containing protein n=1 Tax=Glycine max TaxID=3847 RepID=C6SWH7_SOYBN|nr:unknown [Glycine max]